jgi:hypothetical protein
MTLTPDPPLSENRGSTKARPMNLIVGYVVGAVFYAVCFVIAFRLSPEWWFNLLPVLFGGAVGWCVGMLLSPLTHHEAVQFSTYGKAVSAFITGYVIAKLDAIFAGAVSQQLCSRSRLSGACCCLALRSV